MDTIDERLEALDRIIKLNITIDDLRRIIMLFRYINHQMEYNDESHIDLHDKLLMRWFEHIYDESLKKEGITCF